MASYMKAWDDFLKKIELELGAPIVEKWLKPLKIGRFDACNLYLEAPDSFKVIWFEEHMRHKVDEGLFNNNNKKIKVHLKVRTVEPVVKEKKIAKAPPPRFSLEFDTILPEASFDNFVTSKSANLLAYKLLKEAAVSAPPPFNPIYLFGRCGTGKSHLLMATAAAMREMGKRVIYVRGDTFTEHVVKAIRGGEMQTFRRVYRNIDALFVDGLEVFSRKSATQEEFFHTFNSLHVEGRLIVLSSNIAPGELQHIEPRLTSRFEWGIVVPLQTLPKEQLKEVLLERIEKLGLILEEDAIAFLLESFASNLETLIKAVEALVLRTHLNVGVSARTPHPMSIEEVKHALSDLIEQEEKAELTPAKIINAVAEYYGIRMDDILSKSQARECALPRQIAMHLCRNELGLPFMKIGDIFSRDHSTVMASVKQIQKNVDTKNHEVTLPLKGIMQLLNN